MCRNANQTTNHGTGEGGREINQKFLFSPLTGLYGTQTVNSYIGILRLNRPSSSLCFVELPYDEFMKATSPLP
ncbi:unnamed protein product [Allacma fusca]|uniref:Uncharacterized protein n=1 Tax=Allacma fusca TaxID=39272 RepID=A0A8J2JS85_9HEXA|nr:unnamed protein product [Allacma fusca]